MDRARVLEIIHGFAVEGPLGGIERFGIELARAIDRSRIEPILCGLWRYHTPYEEQTVARLREEGIDAFFAADWDGTHPYRSFWRAWRGTRRYLASQRVHLIHSHCQFGDGMALLMARSLRARAILRTVHNEREWTKRPGRRLLLTHVLYPLLFHLEIGISQQVTANLERRPLARLLKRSSACLYNAVELERFSATAIQHSRERKRRELGLPSGAPVIGTVGRLTLQKGYAVLIKAVAQLLAEIPSVHCLIIGEGELHDELQELSRQLGIAESVHFTGRRPDVEELLAAMDLFVSSSLWEGLPTVILESMAARVPIVATNVSGSRELVQDGVTGLLVPAGDAYALTRAMVRMLRDRALAVVMADQAWERVQDFSITEVAKQHTELYFRLLNPSNPKGV